MRSSQPPSSTLWLRPLRALVVFGGMLASCALCGAGEVNVRMEFLDPVSATESVVRGYVSIDEECLVTWSEPGTEARQRATIGPEDKAEIINELIDSLGLNEIDTRELWSEIEREARRTGLSPEIQGAGTTRIIVSHQADDGSPDREFVIECPACHLLATRYPEVEPLQRFARCQAVLENLRAVMQAGGFEEARLLAEQANAYLAEQGVRHEPFTYGDIRFVRELPGGAKFITFHGKSPDAHGLRATIEPGQAAEFQLAE